METGKTKIKLMLHAMGWEIDYLLNYFTQLKKSKYYLPKNVEVTINVTLNLSDYFINWELSKLPKEFFINKFEHIKPLLIDYKLESKIIHTGVYGHLNAQRDAIDNETEYYILSTPDIIFDEKLLAYYCEAIKSIPNEYFLITPQISKMWDSSWDIITNPLYQNIPYEQWQQKDCFDIIYNQTNSDQEIKLTPLPISKFAGWIDLVNKATYEKLIPIWDEWEGYGGWDYYGMLVTDNFKRMGGDFQQYLLEGQTIVEWTTGFVGHPLVNSYKKLLSLNKVANQGEIFKQNVISYVEKRLHQITTEKL
jgi:hypothetical protein